MEEQGKNKQYIFTGSPLRFLSHIIHSLICSASGAGVSWVKKRTKKHLLIWGGRFRYSCLHKMNAGDSFYLHNWSHLMENTLRLCTHGLRVSKKMLICKHEKVHSLSCLPKADCQKIDLWSSCRFAIFHLFHCCCQNESRKQENRDNNKRTKVPGSIKECVSSRSAPWKYGTIMAWEDTSFTRFYSICRGEQTTQWDTVEHSEDPVVECYRSWPYYLEALSGELGLGVKGSSCPWEAESVLSCVCTCERVCVRCCCYDLYLLFLSLFVSLTGDFSSSSAIER